MNLVTKSAAVAATLMFWNVSMVAPVSAANLRTTVHAASKSQTASEFSARRRHHRHFGHVRHYRGAFAMYRPYHHYRTYYRPFYSSYYRPYYRPYRRYSFYRPWYRPYYTPYYGAYYRPAYPSYAYRYGYGWPYYGGSGPYESIRFGPFGFSFF